MVGLFIRMDSKLLKFKDFVCPIVQNRSIMRVQQLPKTHKGKVQVRHE